MALNNRLLGLGLGKSEASIYLYLVENGVSSPPQIARGTKIALANCYPILRALKEKKLVDEQRKGERKTYVASDPAALLAGLERKKHAALELLPELRALYTTQKNKPKIKFYDGWEQVKEIYLQTLQAEEIWAFGSPEDIDRVDSSFFAHFQKEIKRRQIFIYDLIASGTHASVVEKSRELMGIFYNVAYLPRKYDKLPVDILVWNNNVALISLEEPIIGTVISGGYFAQVFKILLEVAKSAVTADRPTEH